LNYSFKDLHIHEFDSDSMMLLEHTIAHYYSYYFISADYCYAKLNCNFTTIDYNFGYNIASFINNYY